MTKEKFRELSKGIILLDGATGSNLIAAGMPRGVCTEEWTIEHKEIIQQLQRAYVSAGSRVLYAPTFGGNRINLTSHGLADRIEEINRTLVSYTRETAPEGVLVAGDITTTGQMLEPFGDFTAEEAVEVYREQISILAGAGVDLIIAETMINIEEALAAVKAAREVCTLPVLCTMTVQADGSIFTGGNAVSAAVSLEQAGADAVGVNCSVGPDQLCDVIREIRSAVSVPVIAKPNAGMPKPGKNGNMVYHMTPSEFAGHMKLLIDNGASLVGGCCGTTPEFIAELNKVIIKA